MSSPFDSTTASAQNFRIAWRTGPAGCGLCDRLETYASRPGTLSVEPFEMVG